MGGYCKHSAALVFDVLRNRLHSPLAVSVIEAAPSDVSRPRKVSNANTSVDKVSPPARQLEQIEFAAVPSPQVSAQAALWLTTIKSQLNQEARANFGQSKSDKIIYVLDMAIDTGELILASAYLARQDKSGVWATKRNVHLHSVATAKATYIEDDDRAIANLFLISSVYWTGRSRSEFPADAELAQLLIRRLLSTNRCFWQAPSAKPLALAAEETAEPTWETQEDGRQVLRVTSKNKRLTTVRAGGTIWFIDGRAHLMGELKLPTSFKSLEVQQGRFEAYS